MNLKNLWQKFRPGVKVAPLELKDGSDTDIVNRINALSKTERFLLHKIVEDLYRDFITSNSQYSVRVDYTFNTVEVVTLPVLARKMRKM